jgi:valyl-tRNA synthetase
MADDAIDQLYQLPLDEFTAARNALAKESGDNAIKKLEKPTLPAWAVNQLYWRQRKVYDEVIKTSTQVRTAYKQMLGGKQADVKAAEAFHAEAMRRAKDAIRRILEEEGNTASDAVMTPVVETLDALPTTDDPGRLTRPLRRTGFEALQGVTISAKARPLVPKAEPSKPLPDERDKERRKREVDQQELARNKERLRFAESAEREAEAAVDRATRAVERAEKTRQRVEQELDEAAAVEKAARKELAVQQSSYEKAKTERDRLAKKIVHPA